MLKFVGTRGDQCVYKNFLSITILDVRSLIVCAFPTVVATDAFSDESVDSTGSDMARLQSHSIYDDITKSYFKYIVHIAITCLD